VRQRDRPARRGQRVPDKTDKQDALVLADLVRVGYVPQVWLAPAALRDLRSLVRYRQQLARQKRAWLGWLARVELPPHARWVLDQHLAERIKAVEARLAEATRDDPLVAKLRAEPGIGPVTAWTLRAEVGRFDRFRTGKQLARFCGLSPKNASSGGRQADAGLIRAANPELRRVLIEASHHLVRCQARWRALSERLRAAGKPASVRVAAVANRWVRGLHHRLAA
jgi:transposase